ncbi:MAG TPA: MerR family transcriptional regulator [Chloroflexia bacterium]|nr:MerR family transcriptional regulator [Chloroflexia bacterium]
MKTKELTIGELAKQAGVQTSTLRYYEGVGLLPPATRVSGQRRYDPAMLKRLGFIRLAQQAGFTIEEIKILLENFDTNPPPVSGWRRFVKQKLVEIEATITRAQQMKALLEEGLRCGCLDYDECYALISTGQSCKS